MTDIRGRINARLLYIAAFSLVLIAALIVGYKVFAEDRGVEVVTATINYYYYIDSGDHKGVSARIPFVANMPVGSDPRTEKSPDVPGYEPYIENTTTHEITTPAPNVTVYFTEDSVVNVFYKPVEVPYQIELMQQIINTSEYTSHTIITSHGLTGDIPREFASGYIFDPTYPSLEGKTLDNAFEGFTLMYHQPDTIGADGQTKFRCYYDRKTYNVYFELGSGGHGVNPLLKQYGYQLTRAEIGTPVRSGFNFTGWADESDPTTPVSFPVEITANRNFVAMWEPKAKVGYTLVFRNQDKDDEDVYAYWGKTEVTNVAYPGEAVTVDDAFVADCDTLAASLGLVDYQHFAVDPVKTKAENPSVTLKGDGSTIITVYYTRKEYRIWFVYAREKRVTSGSVTTYSGTNATSITDGSSYYMISMYDDSTAGNYAISSDIWTNPGGWTGGNWDTTYGLSLKPLSEIIGTKWTFTKVAGESNKYHISTDVGGNTKYLKLAGNRNVQLSDVAQDIELFIDSEKGYWRIHSGANYLINREKNGNYNSVATVYNGSTGPVDKGGGWYLYPEINVETTGSTESTYYIPTSTGNGSDLNEKVSSGNTGVRWFQTVDALPTVNLPAAYSSVLRDGTYTRTFGTGGSAETYIYHYIELKAKYNSDVENYWPTNKSTTDGDADKWLSDAVAGSVKYKFGSWAINKYAPLRNNAAGQANIVGAFPTLTSDLIIDWEDPTIVHYPVEYTSGATDADFDFVVKADFDSTTMNKMTDLAEIMYAWWDDKGNTSTVSTHAYEIYYEPLPGEDLTGQITDSYLGAAKDPGGTKTRTYVLDRTELFTCAHNGNTRLQPFEYEGMECVLYKGSGTSWSLATGANVFISNSKDATYTAQTTQLNYPPPTGTVTLSDQIYVTKLHYKRKTYNLTFNNMGSSFTATNAAGNSYSGIQFDMPLEAYEPDNTPTYSEAGLAQYYDFVGWGLSDTDTTPIDWSTFTMPAYDLELFAIWAPKVYDVEFYHNEELMTDDDLSHLNDLNYDHERPHYGETVEGQAAIVQTVFSASAPKFTHNGISYEMDFAGWYYFDTNGNLQQFDPETMIISGNLKLFAQWTSQVPTKYAVHYKYKGTKIADDTEGYSYVGLTRTFKAKFDNQLYPGYTTNYFPKFASSSILMEDTDDGQPLRNDKTFEYFYCSKVWFTVRYVEVNSNGDIINDTLLPEEEDFSVSASVTRQFKPVAGYIPQDYFISKILELPDDYDENYDYAAAGEKPGLTKNIITFRYVQHEGFEPYHIKYLLEDDTGEYYGSYKENCKDLKFKVISYIDSAAEKGAEISAAVQNYVGYDVTKYEIVNFRDSVNTSEGLKDVGALTSISFDLPDGMDGVELFIFYEKKSYPVKVTYEIDSADDEKCESWYDAIVATPGKTLIPDTSSDQIGSTGKYKRVYEILPDYKYDSTVSVTAPAVSNYKLTSGNTKTLRVVHEDTPLYLKDITVNTIGFRYADVQSVTYYYKVVIPDRAGTMIAAITDETYTSWKILNQNKETVNVGVEPVTDITAKDYLPPTDNFYRFQRWYHGTYDEDTGAFDIGTPVSSSLVSADGRTLDPPGAATTDQYYFAVYDYVRGDLEIETTGVTLSGRSSEYEVTGNDPHNSWIKIRVSIDGVGSRTITGLPIGSYTVTPTAWPWRYTQPSAQTVTVVETPKVTASFTLSMSKTNWLDGEDKKDNEFAAAAP